MVRTMVKNIRQKQKFKTTTRIGKTFFLILAFGFFFLTTFLFTCKNETPSSSSQIKRQIKQHSQIDLNAFLLDKISNNRIVMVGDHEHGQGLYSRTVTHFLNYWLTKIEDDDDKNIPRSITLFLEHDSLSNHRLYHFFESGNLMDVIEPEDFVVSFSIDKVEFLYELRAIHQRINERNKMIASDTKIQFQVFGPEKIPTIEAESPGRQEVISLAERDKYSADQVYQYLESHPDHRAIIFYGATHLFRKPWFKSTPPYYSYLLGYYLSKKYKKPGGCYTIFQYNLRADSNLPQIFRQLKHSYAIENQYLAGHNFEGLQFIDDSDATLFLDEFYKPAAFISQVPTNQFIKLFLDCLPVYLENPDSPGNNLVIAAACQYLQMVSGFPPNMMELEDIDSIQQYLNDWKMWYLQAGFDPVTWTKGYQFLLSPFRVFRQAPDNQNRVKIESALKNFVGTTLDTLVNDPDEQIRVWLRFLERNRIPILTPRLIQIMWAGTDGEIIMACDELEKLTGQQFQTAKEWTTWWQRKEEIVEKLTR